MRHSIKAMVSQTAATGLGGLFPVIFLGEDISLTSLQAFLEHIFLIEHSFVS